MESYGVFFAAQNCCHLKPIAFAIKAVCDNGFVKDDRFQNYAAYLSANYLYNFILSEL